MTTGKPASGLDGQKQDRTRRLDGVQILRAVAAVMVVLLHAQLLLSTQGATHGLAMPSFTALPLPAGVDLFFVISGFIIVYASEPLFGAPGGAVLFLQRRLLRIVPLYWFALGLRVAALFAGAAAEQAVAPGLVDVATSYLFIPFDTRGFGPDHLFPILDLGWTLNYEMMFYLVFAGAMIIVQIAAPKGFAGITAARETAALTAVVILSAGVLVAWLRPPALDQLRFWLQPIVLEFAAGIGLALLFRRGIRLGRVGGALLCGLGIAVWTTIDLTWFVTLDVPGEYGWARTLIWGGGGVLIVAGLVLGGFRFDHAIAGKVARIGDASYALYLLHPFVFLAAKAVLQRVPLTEALLWPLTLVLVAAAILATLAFHRRVEVPVLRWLQGSPGAAGAGSRRRMTMRPIPGPPDAFAVPRRHTFALLDGLRGVAAILVAIRHAPALFGIRPDAVETYLAVDLFFVLSGFVLAHAYDERIRDGLSAGAFLRIRVIRLYPLYALGLALTVAAALLSFAIGQGPGFSASALAMSTLCAALMLPTPPALSTFPGALFPLNFPSWSIFFELVANMAFFYGLSALSPRRLAAFVALAFAGLCAVALHAGDLDTGFYWRDIHAGLVRVLFAFPVGVLLYRLWIRRPHAASGNAGALTCLGLLTVLLVLPIPSEVKPFYDVAVAACVFPVLVYVAAAITPGPRLTALCLKAGAASYPLYILHAPCVTWAEAIGRRMPGIADRIAAPWSGLVFLATLVAASLVLVRIFDTPARRWLSTMTVLPFKRTMPSSPELS